MAVSTQVVAIDRFKKQIQSEAFRNEIAAALPAHVKPERFQRVLLTSIINDDRLLKVPPHAVIKAALKVAPLGLFTDPLLGEAALVADRNNEVQVRVMYRGLLKLARQSGEVVASQRREVCAKDTVKVSLGTEKKLLHEPSIIERGDVIAYYAVVRYKDGEVDFEIMTRPEIDKIRDKSDGWKAYKRQSIKDTPWASSYDEMAKKTVLRRLLKRVPTSPELADAMRVEDDADRREYGSPVTEAPQSAVMDEPSYVEVVDQHGACFHLPAEQVESWARERAYEATDEELSELEANNKAEKAILDAVAAERSARVKAEGDEPGMFDGEAA